MGPLQILRASMYSCLAAAQTIEVVANQFVLLTGAAAPPITSVGGVAVCVFILFFYVPTKFPACPFFGEFRLYLQGGHTSKKLALSPFWYHYL